MIQQSRAKNFFKKVTFWSCALSEVIIHILMTLLSIVHISSNTVITY